MARKVEHPPVMTSNGTPGPSARDLVLVDDQLFKDLMEIASVNSEELAKATGYSGSYVRQVRSGLRSRVAREFVLAAGNELGRRLAIEGLIATALITDDGVNRGTETCSRKE